MYFQELLATDADRLHCKTILLEFSSLIVDAVKLLRSAWEAAEQGSSHDQKEYHVTVHMFARHVCEMLDGVAVLCEKGCAEPAKPLMRSAFEAMLGVEYILQADHERRSQSYLVAHAHRRLISYRRMDPSSQVGKQLRAELEGDPLIADGGHIDRNASPQIENLERFLGRDEISPVNLEWLRKKKECRSASEWYSLFGGPANIRELAYHLHHGALYEFLYRRWSDSTHAAACLLNIAGGHDGEAHVRPLRHPAGLQSITATAVSFCMHAGRVLLERYGNLDQRQALQAEYSKRIQPKLRAILEREFIPAGWR